MLFQGHFALETPLISGTSCVGQGYTFSAIYFHAILVFLVMNKKNIPQEIDESLINKVVKKISARFRPNKSFLFGSRAWGQPTPDSDLDLFVIMPSSQRRDNRGLEISRLFHDRLFPLDVLVYTPDEVETSLKRGNPFIKEILNHGKILYEG